VALARVGAARQTAGVRTPDEGASDAHAHGQLRREWTRFRDTPPLMQAHLLLVGVLALGLPWVVPHAEGTAAPEEVTVLCLVLVSVLNVELGRWLSGGLSLANQPHKALSAWALACALLLSPPWLLLVVPLTYAHARWRGLRVPLWKWVGSGLYLVLAGIAVALVRAALRHDTPNWMDGDGRDGLLVMLVAVVVFLAVESGLLACSAVLNRAEDEEWLRATLRDPSFYLTETGVLLIGGLLSAVWTGGAWYVLLTLPIYALAQRASLHQPLLARAEAATELAAKNAQLERAHQFQVDLMGMLGHEVGNPLTAVLGYAQIGAEGLADGDVDQAQRAMSGVERNAEQMRRVLNDILALVSSDRGALTAVREDSPVLPHLLAVAEGRVEEVQSPQDLAVHVQPSHLDQVLANLVSNADKYAGGVTSLSARAVGHGRVEIEVADSGPGVPEEFRGRLFERYSREASSSQRMQGSGLGLFISRELVRANGGELEHRPASPHGSVFVVSLARAAD
jgi:signal transduction histidine kinase